MGPPPFGDGKRPEFPSSSGWSWLQWGHRLSAMERAMTRTRTSEYSFGLQWGHRLSAMESVAAAGGTPGPRRFNGATAFRRWKAPFIGLTVITVASFNGATAFRRWKGEGHMEAVRQSAWLQWGHRLSAMERFRAAISRNGASGFNGATAFRRWKERCLAGLPLLLRASMGPPPFGDGKPEIQDRPGGGWKGFNGATAFRRWKACPMSSASLGAWRLQWGHRLSAMERMSDGPRYRQGHDASMGPPPFGDGKGYLRISSVVS